MEYVDPDGLPKLAEKQKARLAGWQRPGEICDNPKMCHLISSLSIKQVNNNNNNNNNDDDDDINRQ